jgi:hypothetical protein
MINDSNQSEPKLIALKLKNPGTLRIAGAALWNRGLSWWKWKADFETLPPGCLQSDGDFYAWKVLSIPSDHYTNHQHLILDFMRYVCIFKGDQDPRPSFTN